MSKYREREINRQKRERERGDFIKRACVVGGGHQISMLQFLFLNLQFTPFVLLFKLKSTKIMLLELIRSNCGQFFVKFDDWKLEIRSSYSCCRMQKDQHVYGDYTHHRPLCNTAEPVGRPASRRMPSS